MAFMLLVPPPRPSHPTRPPAGSPVRHRLGLPSWSSESLPNLAMPGDPSTYQTQWSKLARLRAEPDSDAWSWFIQRYRGYVHAVLRRVLWRGELAEAATEEFWGYLFRSQALARANPEARFRSFLSGVLRNYAAAWSRDNARRADSLPTQHDTPAPTNLSDGDDLALWAQQILHLGLDRLARTRPHDAQVLRWFYGIPEAPGGLPTVRLRATEIARQLGCQANAMHQTLFRARSRLRASISEEVAATTGSLRDLPEELGLLTEAVARILPGLLEADADGEQA